MKKVMLGTAFLITLGIGSIQFENKIKNVTNLLTTNHFQTALSQAQQLVNIAEKDGEPEELGLSYLVLGRIYSRLAQYNEALKYYTKALKIWKNLYPNENHLNVAKSYNYIGEAYYGLGQYNNAFKKFKEALKILKNLYPNEIHPDIALVYNNIGLFYYKTGFLTEARRYLKKALFIRKILYPNENHPDIAESYNNIGLVYHSLGQDDKTLMYFKKALKILKKLYPNKYHPAVAIYYNNIGFVYDNLGQYDKALMCFTKALRIRKNLYGENHPDVATSYNNIGFVYDSLGQYEKGFAYLEKSFKIFQNIFFSTFSSSDRNIIIQKIENYLFFVYFSSPTPQILQKTFQLWLTYKGLPTRKGWILAKVGVNHPTLSQKFKKYQQLQAQLERLRYQARLKIYTPQQRKKIEEQAEEIEKKLSRLNQQILQLPEVRQELNKKVTPQQIASFLQPNQIYIDFGVVRDQIYFFTLSSTGKMKLIKIPPKDSKKILEDIKNFKSYTLKLGKRKQESRGVWLKSEIEAKTTPIVEELYSLLFEKYLQPTLPKGVNFLIISPDGVLSSLPFGVLKNPKTNKYLIENFTISYTPNGIEFLRFISNTHHPNNHYLTIFADNTLPFSQEEINKITQVWGKSLVKVSIGTQLTPSSFKNLNSPHILHLSLHGTLSPNLLIPLPQRAILKLPGNKTISAAQFALLNLKGTSLVFFSSCKTGVVGDNSPDSISQFAKASLFAGAKFSIPTLWNVADPFTPYFTPLFYSYLKPFLLSSFPNNKQLFSLIPSALQKAKIESIKHNRSFLYWGVFIPVF
ncbi:MAG: hypothetical protein C6I01_04485 [Epsilonproteobacteria bacterium]|nr:hypothetical protein [Campylobacterota bacterium]NPA89447.1 tetratricopeptide repeat protein [Campylobacterota bacterium]